MSITTCLTWVRRGVAKQVPDKVQLGKEELRRIIEETRDNLNDQDGLLSSDDDPEEGASASTKQSKKKKKKHTLNPDDEDDDIAQKYGLDDYDDEEGFNETNVLSGIGGLTYYTSNDEDPYITIKDDYDSDEEDFVIQATDNLLVAGKTQGDMCNIEVYVYNEDKGHLYVHHDLMLASFPLAVEWMNFDVTSEKPGNFIAVGTMLPTIDIWDLDCVDTLEPVATLGKKVKKKAKKKSSASGHTDAVLDLSWNSLVRNALASASADHTVGLWDLSTGKIVTSITQHEEKVQCVQWHPYEAQSLLTGSFDNTVKVFDCRNPSESHKSWKLDGEVERVLWNGFEPLYFYATTDSGCVHCIDIRQDKPVFVLSAHQKPVTGISLSSQVPGLLVTTSTDKTMKVWDVQDNKPDLILERHLHIGELHCASCCQESPFVFGIGGQNELKVWDIRESAAVRKHFHKRAPVGLISPDDLPDDDVAMETDTASALESLELHEEPQIEKKKPKQKKTKKKGKK